MTKGDGSRVVFSRRAVKQLRKLPRHIIENLTAWVDDVETRGLTKVRRIPGYHDEPLKGVRAGQRSIRLSKSYRAIYSESEGVIEIAEVHKHEY